MTKSAARILGRYRLDEQLSAGGTAHVWRAHDEQLDRTVAVKLLHPHLLPDETSRLRLAAEARAAASLSHPAIVAVYDVSTEAEAPAIVMELVEGESLAARLRRTGPMDPHEAAPLLAQVAEAQYHAHRRGIVHRDVKPGNILVEDRSGRARLIDFGIAHSLERGTAALTQTGTSLGTPVYMAPEQLAGERVGPRTDLWGLGAVMYEVLTGRPPYDGRTPLALARQQLAGPPSMEGLPPPLAALATACLAARVEDRPLHAGALAAALRAWLAGDAGPALAAARSQPSRTAPSPERDTPPAVAVVDQAPAAPARRRGGVMLAALAVAIASLAVLTAMALGLRDQQPTGVAAATPTAAPATPLPTPDWAASLSAAYLEACGEELAASELAGLNPGDAAKHVEKLVEDCGDEDDDGGEGGRGNGKGKGRGGGD